MGYGSFLLAAGASLFQVGLQLFDQILAYGDPIFGRDRA
jgi:hypothetical protein